MESEQIKRLADRATKQSAAIVPAGEIIQQKKHIVSRAFVANRGFMTILLLALALLHLGFMLAELFPWATPFAVKQTLNRLPPAESLSPVQTKLIASVVRNVAIYNGIVAGGLFYAAAAGASAIDVARVLLIGAAAAGIFGTVTLKSVLPALQALIALIGCYLYR